jgi:hypothetical protein
MSNPDALSVYEVPTYPDQTPRQPSEPDRPARVTKGKGKKAPPPPRVNAVQAVLPDHSKGFFRPAPVTPPPVPTDPSLYGAYLEAYSLYCSHVAKQRFEFWNSKKESSDIRRQLKRAAEIAQPTERRKIVTSKTVSFDPPKVATHFVRDILDEIRSLSEEVVSLTNEDGDLVEDIDERIAAIEQMTSELHISTRDLLQITEVPQTHNLSTTVDIVEVTPLSAPKPEVKVLPEALKARRKAAKARRRANRKVRDEAKKVEELKRKAELLAEQAKAQKLIAKFTAKVPPPPNR